MSGVVYVIECKINQRVYIGHSFFYKRRIAQHLYLLASGKHQNKLLQCDYSEFGEDNFSYGIIQENAETSHERDTIRTMSLSRSLYNIACNDSSLTRGERMEPIGAKNRLTTYVDDDMFEWVKRESKEPGLNESSWIRMIIASIIKTRETKND